MKTALIPISMLDIRESPVAVRMTRSQRHTVISEPDIPEFSGGLETKRLRSVSDSMVDFGSEGRNSV